VDKDFGEDDVANKVELDENTEQDLQVVKEKINKHVIFQPFKMIFFFWMVWRI
jgi:hypothetical protein